MKKLRIVLPALALLLCLSLCGCSSGQYSARGYVVDPQKGEIYDRGVVYTYVIEPDDTVVITYPDGTVYRSVYRENAATHSYYSDSRPPEEGRYAQGETLAEIIRDGGKSGGSKPRVTLRVLFPCLALLGVGIFFTAAPEAAFRLRWSWRFEGVEPSKAGLVAQRVLGGIMIFLAALIFLSTMAA